ncbi:MAG: hypothetical protein HN919_13690 [Verrucomicrobia bacterium]|nr:hypothetical protein [Verrucomicrobiota bacterium]MBT7067352.1 hypothetical protein [Verrucomicrobiota bacterium]MBT7702111.1 hypothetical protein [Verrucomicrobiota bacterium]
MSGENLYSRVKAVWQRDQVLRFTEGSLVLLCWGIVLFLVAALVDWMLGKYLMDLPLPVRTVMLLAVLGGSLYKAWKAGWKHLRPFNATHTALQIEEQKGGMESLLVTALQLTHATQRQGTSDALCDLTCRKAEKSAEAIRPNETARAQLLRKPAGIALAVLLLFGVLGVTHGPLLWAGVGRIFTPWLAITYPTRTQMELVNPHIVVQEGTPVRIAANILGAVPRKAKISLRTGKGRARVRKLPIANGECEYLIKTAYRSFTYRLTAGDARSQWHTVEVVSAPNVEKAEVRLEFPAYTKRPVETVGALTVTVPETTRVTWKLSLDRAVREATINLAGEKPVPLQVSKDGLTVTFEQVATQSQAYGFSWVEREHGFAFTSPNNYLQVSPDRPPRVELTSPKRNIYATLGRKLDLAFRGRDDHGVAESLVCYRIDKRGENRLPFTPAKPIDGSEQVIDWDYRSVLTNLVVGQTVIFLVELADSFPGEKGPHRVRSEARRMQFMSMADYLAQVAKQRQRLLSQLRTTYREERKVHEVVMRLDRSDPIYMQTCQLEAVRQDMTRDSLNKLAGQMLDLTEDMTANGVTNQTLIASLVQLRSDLQRIAADHVSGAADALRALAREPGHNGDNGSAQARAVHLVNSSARELGLLVLPLGFRDAADVMAREMHAASESQAFLRLRTMTRSTRDSVTVPGKPSGDARELVNAQERLRTWLSRLLAACPKGKESTIDDALIEFTLSRMVTQLIKGGIDARLGEAATLIGDGKPAEAARLQSETIAALLKAEFRLRVGAEREALARALELIVSQGDAQETLRLAVKGFDEETFKQKRAELSGAQAALHGNVKLLLMPEIPARRARLFDEAVPLPPPAVDLLAATDAAMAKAVAHLEQGDRAAAEKPQAKVQSSFAELAEIVNKRIADMTRAVSIGRLAYSAKEMDERLERFGERQLSLLEKTEDAAAKRAESGYLVAPQTTLSDAVDELAAVMAGQIRTAGMPSDHALALPGRIDEALQSMRKADARLKENKPGEAVKHQETAIAAFAAARELFKEHAESMGFYASILSQTEAAVAPSSYIWEIEDEQSDMLALTRKTKLADMPTFAIPQKNLVHAVDAILAALDPVAHMVESGTVLLFAKEDMDSAGIALEEKDLEEAIDAQVYIVETLGELRSKVDAIIPQYLYVQEVIEALHETSQEGVLIREAQRRLRESAVGKADTAALAKEQGELKTRAEAYSQLIDEIAGLGVFVPAVAHMAEAEKQLKAGDMAAAVGPMARAEEILKADAVTVLKTIDFVGKLVAAPGPTWEPPPALVKLKDVLIMAARQKDLYRESHTAKPPQLKDYAPQLRELEKACGPFIALEKQSSAPGNLHLKLVAAQGHLAGAAAAAMAADRTKLVIEQKLAATSLRQFIAAKALELYQPPPGPGPPEDPGGSGEDFVERDRGMAIFLPGGLASGKRPPDGKLDWEVLGKRDRAALNENFARELPLEYRAILKDYYERLAK